jgi:hypothetical protein
MLLGYCGATQILGVGKYYGKGAIIENFLCTILSKL